MTNSVKGSCLCGGVAFEISEKWGPVGQCHCSKCRKVSGTDGNATFLARADRFRWLRGEALVKTYLVPNGNGWRSAFCGACGSPVPHAGNTGERYFVPAGLLDDDPGFRGFAAHIYVGSKAAWSVLCDDAPKYVEGFDSARADQG
ncbi:GFA family protein [Terricaulis sp.]|uniref:GFA family protein n=1 Tax=Terricaulis sp. TaxID=2768686 RepID=UPI00378367F3